VERARTGSEKIAVTLGVPALIILLATWLLSATLKRLFGIADGPKGTDSD
jgi:hypothetical protein